jgi:hypothetical protein
MDQDITLRQRLVDNADEIGVVGGGTSLGGLREAHEQMMTQAITAYTNAQDELGSVSGRAARQRLETLKAKIGILQTASTGQAGDYPAMAADSPPSADRAAAAPTGGSGAESPEELMQAMQDATDLETIMDLSLNLTYIDLQTPAHRQLYEAMAGANRATLELERALQESFGTGLMDQFGAAAAGQGLPGASGVSADDLASAEFSLGEISGNSGSILIAAGGETTEVGLVRINGRWFVDGTDEFNALTAMAGDPGMMMQAVQSVGAATGEMTRRVRAGEFSTIEEVMMAFGQAMQGQ